MSVELLQTGALICFGIAGLFLIVAVVLFFVLDVPAIFGEITGATERKAIADIRLQAEGNEDRKTNEGKQAKKVSKETVRSSNIVQNPSTAKLSIEQLTMAPVNTTILNDQAETTVLEQSNGNVDASSNVNSGFTVEVAFEFSSSMEVIE